MRRTLFVILPVFNEEPFLGATLESLGRLTEVGATPRFILVDDGSTDGSLSILHRWAKSNRDHRKAIALGRHLGVGATLHAGFRAVLSECRKGDWATVLEADGSCDIAQLEPMLRKLEEGFDVVIASRRLRGGRSIGFPLNRRIISLAANRLLQASLPDPSVTDYTIFFRAYQVDCLKSDAPSLRSDTTPLKGFAYNAALLLELMARGARIAETPYEYHYQKHDGRRPHSTLGNGLELLRVLIEFRRFRKVQNR